MMTKFTALSAVFRVSRATKIKTYALALLAVFAFVGVLGFFALPWLLKPMLAEKLSELLHRPVSIAHLAFNPYTLAVRIDGLAIRENGEIVVGLEHGYANFEASSLLQGAPVLSEIRLENPHLKFVRLSNKRYNFSDLIDEFLQTKSDEPTPPFSLSNIQISGGALTFDDRMLGEKHTLDEIELKLPFVSSLPYASEIFIEPTSTARLDGAVLHLHARAKPFSEADDGVKNELTFDVDHLPIAQYLDYLPFPRAFKITSGVLNGGVQLNFGHVKKQAATLALSGNATVQDLHATDAADAPLLALKRLDLTLRSADLLARRFVIDRVTLDSPEAYVRRDRQGEVNWLALVSTQTPSVKKQTPSVSWSVGEMKIDRGVVHWRDQMNPRPVNIDLAGIDLALANLSSSAESAKLQLQFKAKQADVKLSGSVRPSPFDADLTLTTKALDLVPLQSYFTTPWQVTLSSAQLNFDGGLRLSQTASATLSGGLTGQATISNFVAADAKGTTDFLKWGSLYLGAIDFRLNPPSASDASNSLSIGEVALTDFFARAVLGADGKLNLAQLIRPATTGTTAQTESKTRMPLKIDRLTLQNGSVNFTDNFVQPHYSANLRQIGGRVSGLSSAAGSVADLELHGSYNRLAPLTIKGKINPLAEKTVLDVQAEIKGLELNTLSPYAGKYAGYAIEKGKLSLLAKYRIENNKLEAENRLFLDQLTFGEPVASPAATKLPVLLAIALLKNRRGEIDIDLPIAGSLDDPQLSVGGLIAEVIGNLFVKTLSAPFTLLGSLFNGGADLSRIEFDNGSDVLTPQAQQHLDRLAKALNERPALRLEITGRAHAEQDRQGLQHAMIERKLRTIKRDDLAKQGAASPTSHALSMIEIRAEEYPALLERAYRAESFPKPRNLLGLVKTLPVEEMEKLMLSNTVIDEDDLRALANRRARAVHDYLLAHGVPDERLFMLPVKLSMSNTNDDAPGSERTDNEISSLRRVDFSLRH